MCIVWEYPIFLMLQQDKPRIPYGLKNQQPFRYNTGVWVHHRSALVVVITANDAAYTAHNCWRSCISCRQQQLMEQFAAHDVISSPTLVVFRNRLKTYRFTRSFLS